MTIIFYEGVDIRKKPPIGIAFKFQQKKDAFSQNGWTPVSVKSVIGKKLIVEKQNTSDGFFQVGDDILVSKSIPILKEQEKEGDNE